MGWRFVVLTIALAGFGLHAHAHGRELASAPSRQNKQEALAQPHPTAAEISKKETVASAFLRGLEFQEYQVRSAAEAMPEEIYGYRPAEGKFKNEKPQFGPAEVRTFAEQVKHVACANFAFAAEFDAQQPPDACH